MNDIRPIDLTTLYSDKTSTASAGAHARPSALPPVHATTKGVAVTATVWNSSQVVNGLWSINQDRNAYVGIASIGWQKLSNASESGLMSLNLLAAHAKQLQTPVNYRIESDNMVHEIYAW